MDAAQMFGLDPDGFRREARGGQEERE